jgi:hypothetical protein
MPHTDVEPHYKLTLTASEFRLIGLGLAKKLDDATDIRDAKALNITLCHQRAKHLRDQTERSEQALKLATQEAK